jgi:hypothetical protein
MPQLMLSEASPRLGRRARPGRRSIRDLVGAGAGALILALAVTFVVGSVVGATEPAASAAAVVVGGDPRSEGSGPGLVGSPLLVLGAVIALGVATALVTAVLVRLTRRP